MKTSSPRKIPSRSNQDILNLAAAAAGPPSRPSGKGKAERLSIPLSNTLTKSFDAFAESRELGKMFDEREDHYGDPLKESCLAWLTAYMWDRGEIPPNPRVSTAKYTAIFMLKNSYRPGKCVPDRNNRAENMTPADYLINALIDGEDALSDEQAASLVDQEVDFVPTVKIRDLNHLLLGHYEGPNFVEATLEEQDVARKLVHVLNATNRRDMVEMGTFSDEERSLLFTQTDESLVMKDSKGFLARLLTSVESLGQFRHVISVFRPDISFSGVESIGTNNNIHAVSQMFDFS